MTVWKAVMLSALLFGLASPSDRACKMRVWAAMMVGSLAMGIYPNLWFYLALDVIVAVVIMMPPKTVWQRAIGLCYVAMLLLGVGYGVGEFLALQNFSSTAPNPSVLKTAHDYLGWVAVAVFFVWGGDGLLGDYRIGRGPSGGLLPVEQGRLR